MKDFDIEFSIVSLDSSATFKTKAELNENRLKFIDQDKNTNYILFKDNGKIEYLKRGSVSMQYRFDENKMTHGTYEVDGNVFTLGINTINIVNDNKIIRIEYELLSDSEVINETTILIKYL